MTTYFEFKSIAELLEDNCDFDSNQKELIQNTSCKCEKCMLAGILAELEEILLEYAKLIQEWEAKLLECPGVATGGVEITGGTAAKISLGVSSEEFELVSGSLGGADLCGTGDPESTAAKNSLENSTDEFELTGGALGGAGLGFPGGEKAGGVPKKVGGATGALPHTSGSGALGGAGHS